MFEVLTRVPPSLSDFVKIDLEAEYPGLVSPSQGVSPWLQCAHSFTTALESTCNSPKNSTIKKATVWVALLAEVLLFRVLRRMNNKQCTFSSQKKYLRNPHRLRSGTRSMGWPFALSSAQDSNYCRHSILSLLEKLILRLASRGIDFG